MWQDLWNRCEINETPYPGYKFVPKPTRKLLDQFEKAHNIALPRGYREFAMLFGAGELAGFYRIATPLAVRNDYDLAKFNRNLHGEPDEHLLDSFAPSDEIDNFFFFCSTGGGVFYGWKIDEVTNVAEHEYAIYEFPEFPPMSKVVNTYREFVLNYVMKSDLSRNWTPEYKFAPFQIEE